MQNYLSGKQIILGITGSIAAYKSPELVRRLREAGAIVRVVMTENAKQFITPLTLQAVSGFPVHDQLFDLQAEAAMGHIELARWADVILIAPATADTLARLNTGSASDLLTTLCLASKAIIALAPAMNQAMWLNQATQETSASLKTKGMVVLDTAEGSQACGDVGPGRMMEPTDITKKVANLFANHSLAGVRVMITAGPTREAIDPVRYLSNKSSGKMGYALATAAQEAGAMVTLITGPTHLATPNKLQEIVPVMTAEEMLQAVLARQTTCDIFIGVAAVADYRAANTATQKIPKTTDEITLKFTRNPDIIATVAALAKPPLVIGFAAETENVLANARQKRIRKKMHMIIANQVSYGQGMESDDNAVTVITEKEEITLGLMRKTQLARQLIETIAKFYKENSHE